MLKKQSKMEIGAACSYANQRIRSVMAWAKTENREATDDSEYLLTLRILSNKTQSNLIQ